MFVGGNVNEFEVEKEDRGDPAVDGGVQLDVGVAEHTFDITGVHFDCEIADADEVEAQRSKRTKKAVEFDLGLGIPGLAFTPRDGTETRRAAAPVWTILREEPPYTAN